MPRLWRQYCSPAAGSPVVPSWLAAKLFDVFPDDPTRLRRSLGPRDSKIGLGTNVELWLPATDARAERTIPEERSTASATGTALLVDDEELVRANTANTLADLGYEVVEATSAEEALRLITGGLNFNVLITDHLMPGMSGTELARQVRSQRSNARVLLVSGFAEVDGVAPDLPRLIKPFRQADLARKLAGLSGLN